VNLDERVRTHLEQARTRTLATLEPFDDDQLTAQVSPLMSPLAWDLAHIAHYEELWLVRALTDAPPTDERYDDLYDAFAHPRRERASLPILNPTDARAFAASVRERTLRVLDSTDLSAMTSPLLRDAFVYGMVVQHEHQHIETMLATINLMNIPYALTPERRGGSAPAGPPPAGGGGPEDRGHPAEDGGRAGAHPLEVTVPGGTFTMGTDSEPWAYDNERPAHVVELAPFRIDTAPVTNAAYAEFLADGGYDDPRLWTKDGWKWRQEAGLEAPQGWERDGSSWSRVWFGRRDDLVLDASVQHVCWHEADAFARWAGKRLPTEAEWERAAVAGRLDRVGDVWEWTATDFAGYPGFEASPYREYSEVFFGPDYKVLRGASWAVPAVARRPTFRNWDFPIRRQIFSGFRCARDG
jgi:gamma-glutamyl hercynylcysteine S-oxide synthase